MCSFQGGVNSQEDFMMDQMLPVPEAMGTNFVVSKFPDLANYVLKIVATENNTVITIT